MYILVELQTTNGVTANIVTSFEDKLQADSAYHSVLASAAVSPVGIHAAVLLDDKGNLLKREFYRHVAPEPEGTQPAE